MSEVALPPPAASDAFAPLSTDGFAALTGAPPPVGAPPELMWVQLADLVVDRRYQRDIARKGVTNVRRIWRDFQWLHFAPLIVARVAGCPSLRGKFAIIDGQHRATAALLRGLTRAPALVIDADLKAQARAFNAVNGNVTQMLPLTAHRAAVTAGDLEALAIKDACDRAGVTICNHAVPADLMKPGQTLALGAIRNCLIRYGAATLITALTCVTETTNNEPGVLRACVISALCAVLDARRDWRDAGERLLRAMDDVDLGHLFDLLESERSRSAAVLAEKITRALTPLMETRPQLEDRRGVQ